MGAAGPVRTVMLKPSLQLRLGQQLTMTPQLQQAIRLLQMPALELQAHIRELLESNVMLEPVEDTESTGILEAVEPPAPPEPAVRKAESTVEVVEESWGEQSVGASETPWSQSDDDDRQQEFADGAGESLQEYLLGQLELARLEPRHLAVARGIVDAISEDGYLTESLEEIASGRREKPTNVFHFGKQQVTTKVYMMVPERVAAVSVDVVDYIWEEKA